MTLLCIRSPFQSSYKIKTNCDNLVNLLCLKYGKYINEGNQKSDHEIYAIKEGGIFIIQTDKGIYTTDFPLQKIDSFIFENSRFDESVFALHGAAVEYDGRAYLLLASTHGGKTTLTSFLTSRGFGYITDDCVLLDRNDFKIYPNNTPIHLRDGGLEVLKKYNAEPTGLKLLDDISIRRHVYTPRNCIMKALPLARIFFITRTETENRLVPMETTERMASLMRAPITDYMVTGDYIKFISRLSGADCSRLLYRDMNYVAGVIRNG